MLRRPFFRQQSHAVLVGVALFLLGSACLYDAWDRRGQQPPRLARPFTWW